MPLMPKRVKFRKQQRGKLRGVASRGNHVSFGDFGLQVTEGGWLTARQIEAGRIAARQYVSREGKLFVRVFPDKPISKKPLETRMGKGKAEPEYWAACVKPGTILYELSGVPKDLARSAFTRVAHKMPFRCRFVERRPAV
ncbi:50S ribosomal protein L16 [Mucisphaera calidilacus]|uniref:Large ribosomal subunit protein uL16 n=1 Tax=Mucisphaera calidilacus TaxID=2527982 RepID=A0A518BXR3_9BACT|nr:50S ribosomal protein L16 [Mucisphaera calidilacus]QDU71769.1 50S ribosomal protein L16 [Mucisphaera calidilacus]